MYLSDEERLFMRKTFSIGVLGAFLAFSAWGQGAAGSQGSTGSQGGSSSQGTSGQSRNRPQRLRLIRSRIHKQEWLRQQIK